MTLQRITPACAGKSHSPAVFGVLSQDHPRMRGEKFCAVSYSLFDKGSPPHARGKVQHTSQRHNGGRITPACAGKSPFVSKPRVVPKDHPRMRGEKKGKLVSRPPFLGSPPHARGKESFVICRLPYFGITPACAGKSDRCYHWKILRRDHPRMRGEKPATL